MRHLTLALLSLGLLSACRTDKLPDNASKSFIYLEKLNYNLGSRGLTLTLHASHPAEEARTIPYRISGEAIRGVDFQLSDSAFILPAGATEASITLTRLQEGAKSRNFQLALLPASDQSYALSLKNFSIIQVLSKAAYRQGFLQPQGKLLTETSFGVTLTLNPSGRYRIDEATSLTLEVDPSSTAVEGEHFSFPQGKVVTVARRQNTAYFKLRFLKKEAGKDRLVLRLAEDDGFTDGRYGSLTITLAGPEDFSGTWKLRELANASDLEGYGITASQLIAVDPADQMTLTKTATGYTLSTAFVSNLRNYFPAQATVSVTGEANLSANGNPASAVPYGELTIPGITANFDPAKPDTRPAKCYFRLVTTDSSEELELLINDYKTSAPSWQDSYSYGITSSDAPLILRFTRQTP